MDRNVNVWQIITLGSWLPDPARVCHPDYIVEGESCLEYLTDRTVTYGGFNDTLQLPQRTSFVPRLLTQEQKAESGLG